jgi:predicted metal-dependent hydrolase
MQYKFRKGEVVWAKIRGFPWWPGMVPILLIQIAFIEESKPNYTESKILVNFIGDKSHAELTIDKLEKFKEKYKEFSKTKKKYLIKSIQIAKKIYKGVLNYDNHFKYIKHKNFLNVSLK